MALVLGARCALTSHVHAAWSGLTAGRAAMSDEVWLEQGSEDMLTDSSRVNAYWKEHLQLDMSAGWKSKL